MTEKRFVSYFDKDHNYIIQDLQNEDEYQVGFVNCDEDIFLKLVNKIADENKQLNQFKEKIFTSIEKEIARNEKTIEWKKETLDLLNELLDVNKQLKQQNEFLKKRCDEYWKEAGLNNDYFE